MIVEDEGFWPRLAQRLFPHRSPPPPETPPTREELVDALAQCDRQLEILRGGPVRHGSYRDEIAEMEAARTGLAQALAELGPPDSLSSPSAAIDPAP